MREVKFRGFSVSAKRWIYGYVWIVPAVKLFYIITGKIHVKDCSIEKYEVYPESIGEYTGLKDKNGKEIYEGDIVEINNHKYYIQSEIGSFMLVRCSDETDMDEQFENCWNDDVYPLSQFYWDINCEEDVIYQCEIIGNVHENKELLESGGK